MQEWLTGCIMVQSGGRISADKRTTRLKLNSLRKCLRDRRPQWFGHVARIEESAWSNGCTTVKVSGKFPEGRPWKHGMR